MTVIAYRDGVLAADTAFYINGVVVGMGPKVFEHAGWLFGSCGVSGWNPDVRRVIDHLDDSGRGHPSDFTWPTFPVDWSCLLVSPEGEVSDIGDGTSRWEPFRTEFLAIGAGAEIATGAMDQGASAEEACLAAVRRSSRCGGVVTALRLAPGRCLPEPGERAGDLTSIERGVLLGYAASTHRRAGAVEERS